MKVEWNLVKAMCNARISDRKALQIAQFRNKGYTMRFYQIGLFIALVVVVFLAQIDARAVFIMLSFLLILGSLFNDAMDYWTGSCLLWRHLSKAHSHKEPVLSTKSCAISPSIKAGLATVFFTFDAAEINKALLLLFFTIGAVVSYVIFTMLFNHYSNKN